MIKQIEILSRRRVADFSSDQPFLIISITDPDAPDVDWPPGGACGDILRLRFHDRHLARPGVVLLDRGIAAAIRQFLHAHPEAETVVCQCEGGVSRSAAIAAALAHRYGCPTNPPVEKLIPNQHVYDLMLAS